MSDDKRRTRFSAVVEEMTEPIKPVAKPEPGKVAAPAVPQLFERSVGSVGETLEPCVRCGCSVYTPAWAQDVGKGAISYEPKEGWVEKLVCRCCPLPPPIYLVKPFTDSKALKTAKYRCACCKVTNVTKTLDRVNLWCGGCSRLAIHETFGAAVSTPRSASNGTSSIITGKAATLTYSVTDFTGLAAPLTNEKSPTRACARCGHGEPRHRPNCQWTSTCDCEGFVLRYDDARLGDDLYGMIDRANEGARISELADAFYARIGLEPKTLFSARARDRNMGARMREDDWERRTGRTTRGLIEALAEVVIQQAGFLYVLGSNNKQDQDLIKAAWDYYYKIGGQLTKPLTTVRVADHPTIKLGADAVLFVDHHYYEVLARATIGTGRYR